MQSLEKKISQKRPGQLLAAITDNLPIVVGRLDRDGRVIEAEGHGLAAQGMAPPRILGQLFPRLYPETADAIAQAAAENAGNCTIRGRKHGKKWHVELYVFPDASQIGEMVFFGRDVTIRKDLESRLLSISDLEQRRIGADLHDGLGQHLTGTACIAATLCDKLKSGHSPHADQAASIAALINAAIDMTRGLARGLCPVQIEKGGLGSALEDLSYQVQRLHSIRCSFSRTCASPDLEPHVALHLYRIAQEAINNVLRHSSANEILVTLSSAGGRAILAIEDNGCGFDPATRLNDHRLGLRLMDYRAAMVGGTLKVGRRKNGGMRVECTFLRSFY
jgi:signal transduction histidine kinase